MEQDIAHPAPWRDLVLVCRKCGEKLGGGFGADGQENLRDLLKSLMREAGLNKVVRVVESGCLDLCPKDAVSVMRIADPATILAVPPRTDPAAVLRRLGVTPAIVEF